MKTKLIIALILSGIAVPVGVQAQVTPPTDQSLPNAARIPSPPSRGWPVGPAAVPSLRGAPITARTLNPNADVVQALRRQHSPEGNWGGAGCPTADELRSIVDSYLATSHPDYPSLGSTIPGASVSWRSKKCGTFTYAAGLRTIETNEVMVPASRMLIASMTKPIMTALTLILNEKGVFGPRGLDTVITQLLPPTTIKSLTVGDHPNSPQCPGTTYLLNRLTFQFESYSYSCPDLSLVTLRNLMTSNHGMYDIINEVLTPDGLHPYFSSSVFYDLYKYFGLKPRRPPSSPSGFENLKWYGLKRNDSGIIGGSRGADFEASFGNTGFQLLGVILEQRTQTSLDSLIKTFIVEPLNIDPIIVYVDPRDADKKFADGYSIVTGDPDFEQSGVYPLVALRGHKAVNNRSLGLGKPSNIDLAGGAGGLIANPRSYVRFLDALVNGGLLDRPAQRELDNSFVRIFDFDTPTITGSNGFGLIKVRYTNDPLVPNIEWIYHNGSWPGASCWDGVIRTHNSSRTIATGVVCQNTNFFLAYPDQYFLMTGLITAIVEADKGLGP